MGAAGLCELCGQVRTFPRGKDEQPRILRMGWDGAKDLFSLSSEERALIARVDIKSASVAGADKIAEPEPVVETKKEAAGEGPLVETADVLEPVLVPGEKTELREKVARGSRLSLQVPVPCKKCRGELLLAKKGLLVCSACGEADKTIPSKHRFIEANRGLITSDLYALGQAGTIRKWHISSGSIATLIKRWHLDRNKIPRRYRKRLVSAAAKSTGAAQRPAPGKAAEPTAQRPASLPGFPSWKEGWTDKLKVAWLESRATLKPGVLPDFPAWNEMWPDKVKVAWLESYALMQNINKGGGDG